MILINFQLARDLIGLETEGGYIDLHNNYNFVGYSESSGGVTFNWQRIFEPGVPAQAPNNVSLAFGSVSYLERRGAPSGTLMEFGFFPNELRGPVEYNGSQNPSTGCELFVARFEGGAEFAILAASASAYVSNGA